MGDLYALGSSLDPLIVIHRLQVCGRGMRSMRRIVTYPIRTSTYVPCILPMMQ